MESNPAEHAAPTKEAPAAADLNGGAQNEAGHPDPGNPPATVSEALAALDSDEHPLGAEIRKQVRSVYGAAVAV
jgi:hypothetical protein